MAALVLTAALPPAVESALGEERRALAEAAAVRAPVHLALFRHLPGTRVDAIRDDLERLMAGEAPPRLQLAAPAAHERAILLPATSSALVRLREALADMWAPFLLEGERAPPRLHVTLAAGLAAGRARQLAAASAARLSHRAFIGRPLAVPALEGYAVEGDGTPWTRLFSLAFTP